MSTIKTKATEQDVATFIENFAPTERRKEDAFFLKDFMEKTTGFPAVLWGESMIGFGSYHYKSERSRQEGDWPLVGFSPRKAAMSLYVYSGSAGQENLLKDLGKFKMGKSCIYVNKISDIDLCVLENLIQSTVSFLKSKYPETS